MKNSLYKYFIEHLPARISSTVDKTKLVRLDLAEGLTNPSPNIKKALNTIDDKYIAALPERNSIQLKKALSKFLKVKPDHISIFAGSDEAIELIPRIYLEPGDTALAVSPLFQRLIQTNYKVGAKVHLIVTNAENSFDISPENYKEIERFLTDGVKLVWFCTPNNPTGVVYDKKLILSLIKNFPNTMFVVDEVYQEYFSLDPKDSYASYVGTYKNLIVLRSFSKAFSLAGIRVGYAISNPETISNLCSFKIMYNLSFISQELALSALKDIKYVRKMITTINTERDRVVTKIREKNTNIEIINGSTTNLIFLRHKQTDLFKLLMSKGYIPSDWRISPGVENMGFVRITIGTKEYNDQIIKVLTSC